MINPEHKLELNRRQEEIFRRLHRLVKQGYVPDWSITDVEDAIWFKHSGKGPDLILYPDGMIVGLGDSQLRPDMKNKDRICNKNQGDVKEFNLWLSSIPKPTWRQRTAKDRYKYVWEPIIIMIFLGFLFSVGKLFSSFWD